MLVLVLAERVIRSNLLIVDVLLLDKFHSVALASLQGQGRIRNVFLRERRNNNR